MAARGLDAGALDRSASADHQSDLHPALPSSLHRLRRVVPFYRISQRQPISLQQAGVHRNGGVSGAGGRERPRPRTRRGRIGVGGICRAWPGIGVRLGGSSRGPCGRRRSRRRLRSVRCRLLPGLRGPAHAARPHRLSLRDGSVLTRRRRAGGKRGHQYSRAARPRQCMELRRCREESRVHDHRSRETKRQRATLGGGIEDDGSARGNGHAAKYSTALRSTGGRLRRRLRANLFFSGPCLRRVRRLSYPSEPARRSPTCGRKARRESPSPTQPRRSTENRRWSARLFSS